METIKHFESFNHRRYSDPWVARMYGAKISFNEKVGEYTGGFKTGNEGELVVYAPEKDVVYAWGQKDYRGNNGSRGYVKWDGCRFVEISREEAIAGAKA